MHFSLKDENSQLLGEDLERRACVLRALPEVINLNHSNACNLQCGICPRSGGERAASLSREVLARLTAALFPAARKAVLTMAGEPLMADFDFLLGEALRHGVRLDVMTNGMLLTPEIYRSSRRALDHLNVSVDSHVPGVYERLRRGASFEGLRSNLSAIRSIRQGEPDDVIFSLSAVVLRSNIGHLPEFIRFAAGLNADGVILQRLRHEIMDLAEEEPSALYSPEEVSSFLEKACHAAREAGINLICNNLGRANVMVKPLRPPAAAPRATPGICSFLVQNFDVLFTGEVYACCVPTDHYLGSVHQRDPAAIWNGRAFAKLREAHWSGRGTVFCSGCSQVPHLAARKPEWWNGCLKKARRALCHVIRKRARRRAFISLPPSNA